MPNDSGHRLDDAAGPLGRAGAFSLCPRKLLELGPLRALTSTAATGILLFRAVLESDFAGPACRDSWERTTGRLSITEYVYRTTPQL